ncbi:MAG: PQQ-dependent sugar dehydrogenase, partial [Limisphaerales bacterium]
MKKFLPFLTFVFCSLVFAGVAAAQTLPKIELKQVFQKLQIDRPVWMSEAPDGSGRFFVVGQAGKILIVKKGSDGSDAKVFLDIEDRHPYFNNEDGLLSIAFHPGFKTNGLFYIYYTQKNKPEDIRRLDNGLPVDFPYRSVVSEFKVSATDPDKADMSSERIIFEVLQPYWNHKGGELCFGPDGYLYLGLGDG